mgnify:CR=1 FL=1
MRFPKHRISVPMTIAEATEILRAMAEDDEVSYADAAELFTAVIGRAPDADDGDAGALLSHCYAAIQ